MKPRRCLICERLVPIVMLRVHVLQEHPIVAAAFREERAEVDVLFEAVKN